MSDSEKDPSSIDDGLMIQAGNMLTANANEVLLVGFIVDDSDSIREFGNTPHVITGHNAFLERLYNAPGRILFKTMFLNADTEGGFVAPGDATLLTEETYSPNGSTPLFMRVKFALGELVRKASIIRSEGKLVRLVVLIFTDGADNASQGVNAAHVREIVGPMVASGRVIVGGCALSDGKTDFKSVFMSMGIPEQLIIVLRDRDQVVEAMRDMGNATSVSSAGAASFHHTSVHGFRPSSSSH